MREAFEGALEAGLRDLLVRLGGLGIKDLPGFGLKPDFVFDGRFVAAHADVGVAGEHVGDVDGGGEFAGFLAALGLMMVARDFDENGRELVLRKIDRAEFGVVHTEDAPFTVEEVFFRIDVIGEIDGIEMFLE